MSNYELWLSTDSGVRLALLDMATGFDYAINLHAVGACVVTLPADGFDRALLAADRRLEVWRQPEGGALALERVYLVRRVQSKTDVKGSTSYLVNGVDANDLLRRRIVYAAAGSAGARMTDQADDMMKAIVYNEFGGNAALARQIASTYFARQGEASAGPSLTLDFAYRNVLAVLQDIAGAAEAAGTPVYFHVADATPSQWEFRTYTGQPGQDHTYPGGQNPVILGLEYGNLAEPTLDEDYTKEITYAYAGGQGEGSDRNVQTAEDTARSWRSLFGRCEGWADARQADTDAAVLSAAQTLLNDGRPRLRFSAKLVDSPGTRYGIHWRWGDRVTAGYEGYTFDALVRAVHVSAGGNGKETIDARLEVVT